MLTSVMETSLLTSPELRAQQLLGYWTDSPPLTPVFAW